MNQSTPLLPGADLVERGLAWRENIRNSPEFLAVLQEIREAFPRL